MNAFTNKVVIVTGGGAGIGRAAALQFAEQGARVIVTGRRAGPLQIVAAHHNITFTVADAGNEEDDIRTVRDAVDRCGRLDVLVNNAGAGAVLPLAQASSQTVAQIFAVNVFGPSALATAAIPYLKASGGSIVNVSSTLGQKAVAGLSHYAASKAALEHLTRCWALELAPVGVRVNAVAAGPIETEFLMERTGLSAAQAEAIKADERGRIPLRRSGTAEEIAQWIVSLASPAAAWITGQVIAVDGGLSIA